MATASARADLALRLSRGAFSQRERAEKNEAAN
jgi:hypothetical protein